MTTSVPINDLFCFLQKVADTSYGGRPCSHEDGCHADDSCDVDDCSWSVSPDEEHDNLIELVSEARQLLGLPDLYEEN